MNLRILGAITLLSGLGSAAAADQLETADACILERFEAGTPVTACIDAAHATCLAEPEDTAAVASVCFRTAQEGWNAGIKALMDQIRGGASDDIATVAAIEVKYDVLAALMQCDRMQELALAVSDLSQQAILRRKSQCDATGLGLAYARLKLRARDIE